MKFLIDENVDIRVIAFLKKLNHDAKRVPTGIKNGAVIKLAKAEKRILLTLDADFTNTSQYPPMKSFGIIRIAIHPPWFSNMKKPLSNFLSRTSPEEIAGKLIILEA